MSSAARGRMQSHGIDKDEQYKIFMRLPLTDEQRLAVLRELLQEPPVAHRVTFADEDEVEETKDEEAVE